jgi:hypothetical protein
MNSGPQSENDRENNEGEGKGEREGQDAHKVVGATTLGLQTKSGLRPNSKIQGQLIYSWRAATLTR